MAHLDFALTQGVATDKNLDAFGLELVDSAGKINISLGISEHVDTVPLDHNAQIKLVGTNGFNVVVGNLDNFFEAAAKKPATFIEMVDDLLRHIAWRLSESCWRAVLCCLFSGMGCP
jgi:hypothetical protein